MKTHEPGLQIGAGQTQMVDDEPSLGLADLLTWVGEGKRLIAIVTIIAAIASAIH